MTEPLDNKKPEFVSIHQAAAMMSINAAGVMRWVQLKRLAARIRPGRGTIFKRSDVLAALEKYEYGESTPKRDPSFS